MQLDLNDLELELIGKALEVYAGHALEYSSRENGMALLKTEYIGRCLCSKVLKFLDYNAHGNTLEKLFDDARNEFCGIANDADFGTSCIMGGLDDAGLETATSIIKDKKQRQDFKANYKKMLASLTKNMEQYK